MNLEQKLQQFEEEKAGLEAQPYHQDRQERINWLQNAIGDLRHQLGMQQERVQKQEQKMEELSDLVLGHNFNEVFKNPEANKIIHLLLTEQHQQLFAEHNEEVDRLNGRIRAITEQKFEAEQQTAEVRAELQEALNRNIHLVEQYNQEFEEKERLQAAVTSRDAEIARLRGQIAELEQQLEQASKPKQSFKSSESLSQLVENAKKASETTLEAANRGLARWGLPPVGVPENPFRGQDDAVGDGPQESVPAEAPQVGESFREEVQAGESGVAPEDAGLAQQDVGEMAAIEERVAQLEARVAALEGYNVAS
jgi:chromosome segregation ATPase